MSAHGRETVSAQCLPPFVHAGEVHDAPNKARRVCERPRVVSGLCPVSRQCLDGEA